MYGQFMTGARVQLTDYDAAGRVAEDDLAVHSASLSDVVTMELDGAAAALGVTAEDILLAALGRAIDRAIGDGFVLVDVTVDVPVAVSADVSADVTVSPVRLTCAGPDVVSATDMLAGVHHSVAALTRHRAVYGVADGDADGDEDHAHAVADVLFASDEGDGGSAGMGHRLELHAYRRTSVVMLDWWYDVSSFEPYSVTELAEQFPLALIELTSEAAAPIGTAVALVMAY